MRKTEKLFIVGVVISMLIGFVIGANGTIAYFEDDNQPDSGLIRQQVEIVIEDIKQREEVNLKLYEAIYFNVDTGETEKFYFKSNDPFARVDKIMENEKFEFRNLRLKESDLLEEEK